MVKKKVAFLSGTRAEYGLLKPLMELVLNDPEFDFELYVTGTHLSHAFGHTVDCIRQDGIPVAEELEILVAGDTGSSVTKSMGLALISFGDVLTRRKPDILVLLGDRYEAFCGAAAALVVGIPVAHIHGGELTLGAMDEAFRHSITKMSSMHFTATETYRKRVIQLGEHPDTVYNVGAPGVENIKNMQLLDYEELTTALGFKLPDQYALCTIHPETRGGGDTSRLVQSIFKALNEIPELFVLFTKANADPGGQLINTMIEEYCIQHSERAAVRANLGQKLYLSVMRYASLVLGNSSSGIIEAPSFGVPTVDVGERQLGRDRAASVINCPADSDEIAEAINRTLSPNFRQNMAMVVNPYDKPGTFKLIANELKRFVNNPPQFKNFYEVGIS